MMTSSRGLKAARDFGLDGLFGRGRGELDGPALACLFLEGLRGLHMPIGAVECLAVDTDLLGDVVLSDARVEKCRNLDAIVPLHLVRGQSETRRAPNKSFCCQFLRCCRIFKIGLGNLKL